MRVRGFGRRGSPGVGVLILLLLAYAVFGGGEQNSPRRGGGSKRATRSTRQAGQRAGRGARHRGGGGAQRDTRRGPVPGAVPGEPARVVRVVDGDTIVANVGGADEYVRYIGVDTPETVKPGTPVQCYGEPASHFNHGLVEGRRVILQFDSERRDIYGRLLAYVYLGRRFVNAILVRGGYARTLTIAPNDSRADLFARLAAEAGRAGRGLWGSCRP